MKRDHGMIEVTPDPNSRRLMMVNVILAGAPGAGIAPAPHSLRGYGLRLEYPGKDVVHGP